MKNVGKFLDKARNGRKRSGGQGGLEGTLCGGKQLKCALSLDEIQCLRRLCAKAFLSAVVEVST